MIIFLFPTEIIRCLLHVNACLHVYMCHTAFSKVEGSGILCLNNVSSVSHALHFLLMGLVAPMSKLIITAKPLHTEHFQNKYVVQLLSVYLEDGTYVRGLPQGLSSS